MLTTLLLMAQRGIYQQYKRGYIEYFYEVILRDHNQHSYKPPVLCEIAWV